MTYMRQSTFFLEHKGHRRFLTRVQKGGGVRRVAFHLVQCVVSPVDVANPYTPNLCKTFSSPGQALVQCLSVERASVRE